VGRGDGFSLGVAEDLGGGEALELGDGEGVDGGGDGVPGRGVGEGEGEVAFDGLEAGEIVGGDFFERERVEGGQVELGEVDGLAELAGVALGVDEFAKVGEGVIVQEGGGGAAGLKPSGGVGDEGEGRGAAGQGEEGDDGLDGSLELEEGGVGGGVEARGLGLSGGEAEGELGGLVDVGDEGAVGRDGAGEDVSLLEEANVFDVAIEVVGEHGEHAGDE